MRPFLFRKGENMANDTKDVSNAKGVLGGYSYSAVVGSEVGTVSDPFAALDTSTFGNMGIISEDGIEEEIDADTEEIKDMNGDVIFVAKSSETETLVLTLVSVTEQSLGEWYGVDNVDASNAGYIAIEHVAKNREARTYVFELLLKDGRKWRKHVPNGVVSEVGSIVYSSGEVVGREITITCMPDANGVRMYDYIEKSA